MAARGEAQDKTPVGVLQESCIRKGIVPFYELVAEGPIFEYRVKVEEFFGYGKGRKKKFAKQAAAKMLLGQIIEKNKQIEWNLPGGALQEDAQKCLDSLLSMDVETTGEDPEKSLHQENTIAILLDYCRKRRLPLPFFEETSVSEGIFGCTASVGKVEAFAQGRNKKGAKRCSARALLDIMKESEANIQELDEDLDGHLESGSAYPKDLESQLSAAFTKNTSIIAEGDGERSKENLSPEKERIKNWKTTLDLDKKEPDEKLAELLNAISVEENGYPPTYYPLDYRSKEGLYQCIVQLPATPVVVSYGQGKGKAEAKWKAAQNALNILKIMEKGPRVKVDKCGGNGVIDEQPKKDLADGNRVKVFMKKP